MMNEDEVRKFWEANDIYAKAKKARASGKKFYFMDGPPYATGSIHMGTAINKTLKDAYVRFWRMHGFDVWDRPAYDTHGIPIENKVEQLLGIKTKSEIEKLGIENFIAECKKFATKYIDVMNSQFANLGVWLDWKNACLTLNKEYIEGVWHTFKIGYEKDLLYHGLYSVHVCPHCETAVAYNEIEYKKVTDASIYVKFRVEGKKDEYFVIWTTTPWTIPSNTGIMVKPDATYVRADTKKEILIVAKDLLETLMSKFGITNYTVIDTVKGKDLEGTKYVHPLYDGLPFLQKAKNAHRIVLSEQFVSLEDGTGLVHTAPGHGKEDYTVGKASKLPIINPLDLGGRFGQDSGKYAGMKARDANRTIIDDLRAKGSLIMEEDITHDYPLCWRCSSHLLQMAVPQWFFRVTKIRKKLLNENKKVLWQPEWAKKRFVNWLESLDDWPVSRQRYWGIPLPIWKCEKCDKVKVIGSSDELPELLEDLHRPYIDRVTFGCDCGSVMKRIPDVLDVWFDSGAISWASIGYPKNKKIFEKFWPPDINIEGPDQIRGWWNSQLIMSVITFDRHPFKNILFHGFVLDAHGIKMSKSKGNIVAPEEVIEKHGRDILRFYLLSSAPWNDFYFKWEDVEEMARAFVVIKNTFNFVSTYVKDAKKPRALKNEDKWILSKLNVLAKEMIRDCETYNMHKATQKLLEFLLNDFSRWYIKIIRDRVRSGDQAAQYTLAQVSVTCLKLLAPFMPFLAESAFQGMKAIGADKESVHLCTLPEPESKLVKKGLNEEMEIVKEIVEATNIMRKENSLKLRWPVRSMHIETTDKTAIKAAKDFNAVIKEMANVLEINMGQSVEPKKSFSKGTVYLDTAVAREEAFIRELTRAVQNRRKEKGLTVEESIILYLDNDSLREFEDKIREKVGAREIRYEAVAGAEEVIFESLRAKFKLERS